VSYLTTPVTFGSLSLPLILAGTAAGYGLSALAAGFVVSTGRLFEATPAAGTLGPETVLADLADPVIVVDRSDRIVRLNEQAAASFGTTVEESVGQSFTDVVGVPFDAFDGPDCIELTIGGRTRYFEGTAAAVEDRHGRTPGRAVVIRDVTNRRLRGQRLTVLNRVLRHNLRNQMTSIIGRAEMLADGGTQQDGLAEGIITTADDLVTLGERAREVEQMMSVAPNPDTETSVELVVRTVVETVGAEYPEVAIRSDVDADLTVPVDERILAPVLRNVVENAAQHNDAETPEIDITARVAPDRQGFVALTVTDNGPGIPDEEQTVIRDAEESPLEHGSGLGLWAVYWGVTRMGGELEFAEQDPRGATVRIRVPGRTGATADPVAAAPSAGAD
jgi:signal transduction histidine kinase